MPDKLITSNLHPTPLHLKQIDLYLVYFRLRQQQVLILKDPFLLLQYLGQAK